MANQPTWVLAFRGSLRRWAWVIAVLVACAAPAAAQDAPRQETVLGTVNFNASCSGEEFDRAMAFLHHMQYVESRAAFERIVQSDPECGMAHWGIAMTLFQPLWPTRPGPEALRRGWEEIRRAQELGAGSDREALKVTVGLGRVRGSIIFQVTIVASSPDFVRLHTLRGSPLGQFFEVSDDKISRILLVFDTGAFT